MPFPDAPRVLYRRNPLETVICQLRFPSILRIDAEEPAAFQERIRTEYPILNTRSPVNLPENLPPEIAKAVEESLPPRFRPAARVYDFVSADSGWKVTLARDFIALTASRGAYARWEDFEGRLRPVLEAAIEIYRPAFFQRIGLRYQNVIRRSALGLGQDIPWSELLQPHVAGELAKLPENAVDGITTAVLLRLGDSAKAAIQHGLGRAEGSGEVGYIIDSDFFTDERTEVANAEERLRAFNREARRLFHWCITVRLHDAMGPDPL